MNLDDFRDIFEPFERLVEIEIGGVRRSVPENNSLLRCFQFLSIETISYGDFCWNGDCLNCRVTLATADGRGKTVIACRTRVAEDMKIIDLGDEIKLSKP